MSDIITPKVTKRRAGLYTGTMTVEGHDFEVVVERGDEFNAGSGDRAWWRVEIDGDSSGWDYRSKREALLSVTGEWYIDPTWGLCTR